MATCSFIREKKQTAGAMGGVLRYVAQEQKTVDTDGTRYLTGINCAADLAYQSFLATKNLYGKARGTWFYHYVQSFPPQERVTPAEAHQIAQELAERFFPDCEVLVATHIDRAHLHSHLVVNSVKPDTGEKLHFTPRTLERMRLVSDQICREHGLTTLKPYRQKKQVKGLRPGEYRSAMRGQSWKFQLIAVIEAAMERAGSREEFLDELRRRGYDARWEEGRRSITYITPAGMRCRDDKLHEEKFRKEKIEDEFRIRQCAAQHHFGQAETADAAYADRSTAKRPLHHADNDGGAAGGSPAEDPGLTGDHPGGYGDIGHQGKSEGTGHRPAAGGLAESDQQHPSEDLPGPGTDGPGNKGGTPTGWEAARRIYEETLRTGSPVPPELGRGLGPLPGQDSADAPGIGHRVGSSQRPDVAGAAVTGQIIHLLARLEGSEQQIPVQDSTTLPAHMDRKAWAKERRHRMSRQEAEPEEGQKLL